jgi:hypothetical protein
MPTNPVPKEAASRIYSAQDKAGQGTGKNSFAAHTQSAADKYASASGEQHDYASQVQSAQHKASKDTGEKTFIAGIQKTAEQYASGDDKDYKINEPGNPIPKEAASEIQSTQAHAGKYTDKDSFAACVQSAADKQADVMGDQDDYRTQQIESVLPGAAQAATQRAQRSNQRQ